MHLQIIEETVEPSPETLINECHENKNKRVAIEGLE